MVKAKPLSENASSDAEPSRNDSVTSDQCGLCGEPIKRGQVVQAVMGKDESSPMGKAHLRCWSERELVKRAMGSHK